MKLRILVSRRTPCRALFPPLVLAAGAYTQGACAHACGAEQRVPADHDRANLTRSSISTDALMTGTWCDTDWEGNRGWIYADYLPIRLSEQAGTYSVFRGAVWGWESSRSVWAITGGGITRLGRFYRQT